MILFKNPGHKRPGFFYVTDQMVRRQTFENGKNKPKNKRK